MPQDTSPAAPVPEDLGTSLNRTRKLERTLENQAREVAPRRIRGLTDQQGTVQPVVDRLAGRLWEEYTRVARRPVRRPGPGQGWTFGAHGIERAPACPLDRLPNHGFEPSFLTQAHEPTERALAISGCRVDQYARHRRILISRHEEPLAERCRPVATLEDELVRQYVGQGMDEQVT